MKNSILQAVAGALICVLAPAQAQAQSQAEVVPSAQPPATSGSAAGAVSAAESPASAPSAPVERTVRLGDLPALLGLPAALPPPERAASPASPKAAGQTQAPTPAQRPGPSLSLQQAIERGLANSLDVQASAARRESFEQTALAARGALLPRLDARAASGQGRLESVDPIAALRRKDGSLTLRQPVFDVPSVREYRRQGVLANSAAVQTQGAESAVSLDVASAYLQATQVTLNIELSRGYEALLMELQEYITQRAQAGGASNAERDRVRARVANARSSIADSKANLRTLLRNLESLIGEAPGPLVVEAPAWLRIPLRAEEARSEAEQTNHDLRVARAEVDAAALERGVASARVLPRMDFEVTHARNLNGGGTASYTRDTKFMLVLNWSMLNGGTDLAQERAASARTREKQLRANDVRRKLWQELDTAYTNLDAVAERQDSLREELTANRAVVDAFRAQLVGGNRPLLDVLDALQRLHQSRLDLVQLALGEVQNQVKVAHLTGRLAAAGIAR